MVRELQQRYLKKKKNDILNTQTKCEVLIEKVLPLENRGMISSENSPSRTAEEKQINNEKYSRTS